MSDEAYRNAESAVLSDISMAYYDALISRDQLKLVEESIARWEESRKDTQAMFRQGVVADIDTLKAFLSVEKPPSRSHSGRNPRESYHDPAQKHHGHLA